MKSIDSNKKEGKIVNFYSFKGGVGRTVTLKNVASLLRNRGCKVAVVDMDLECPGLTIINSYGSGEGSGENENIDEENSVSLLNIANGYLECIITTENSINSLKIGNDYIRNELDKYLDNDFLQIVAHDRNGKSLTENDFDEYVKKLKYLEFNQFSSVVGHFLDFFLKLLKNNFDYVLIDNRTGLSEASIWNIRKFSDLTIWILTLSIQNLEGVRLSFNRFSLPFEHSSCPDYSSFIFVANISPPLPKFIEKNTSKLSKLIACPKNKIINIEYAPEPIFNELFERFPKINIQYQNIVQAILESDEKTTAYRKRYASIGCMFFSITELECELINNNNVKDSIVSSDNYKSLLNQINKSNHIDTKLECINMLFTCMFKNKSYEMITILHKEILNNINLDNNNNIKLMISILIKVYAALLFSKSNEFILIEQRLDKIYFKGLLSNQKFDPIIEIIGSYDDYNMYLCYRLSNIYNLLLSKKQYNSDYNKNIIIFLKLWYLLSENTISLRAFVWPPRKKSSIFPLLDKLFKNLSPKRNTFLFNALACINTDINNKSVPVNIIKCLEKFNK